MDVGCYPISFANLIFGELPERVKAAGVYRLDSPDIDLTMCGILEYSQGRLAVFDSSFAMEARQGVEIVGTGGTIQINRPWRPDRAERLHSLRAIPINLRLSISQTASAPGSPRCCLGNLAWEWWL